VHLYENDSLDIIRQNENYANSFYRAHTSFSRETDVKSDIISIFFTNFFDLPFLKQ